MAEAMGPHKNITPTLLSAVVGQGYGAQRFTTC
jgi:hypothetical protein